MEQTLNHKIFLIKTALQENFVAGNSKAKKKKENKTTQGCASRRHAEWYWHFFYATRERVSPLFSALREAFRWDVLGGSRQRLGAWLPWSWARSSAGSAPQPNAELVLHCHTAGLAAPPALCVSGRIVCYLSNFTWMHLASSFLL